MSHTPHELAELFPEQHALISQLQQSDAHFVRLTEKYHETNREIHRIEAEIEAASDDRLEALKKSRLHMADEVRAALAAAQ